MYKFEIIEDSAPTNDSFRKGLEKRWPGCDVKQYFNTESAMKAANVLNSITLPPFGGISLRNDAALSRWLYVGPPVISKMRAKKLAIGASILVRLHEISDIDLKDLRTLMGDHRSSFFADF